MPLKKLSPVSKNFNLQKNNKIDKAQVRNHIQKLKDFHKLKNMDIPNDYIKILEQKMQDIS